VCWRGMARVGGAVPGIPTHSGSSTAAFATSFATVSKMVWVYFQLLAGVLLPPFRKMVWVYFQLLAGIVSGGLLLRRLTTWGGCTWVERSR